MDKLILTLIIISFHVLAQNTELEGQNSGKVQHDTIYIPNHIDTVFIPVPVDTLRFNILSKENVPKQSWWYRNEGTILGSFLAAIVALMTISITTYISNRNSRIREENIYTGHWCAVYGQSFDNEKELNILISELESFKNVLNLSKTINIDSFPIQLSVNFLNYCKLEFLKFAYYDLDLHKFFSSYINSLEALINELNFKRIHQSLADIESSEVVKATLNEYVDSIISHIKQIIEWQVELREMINKEITRITGRGINIKKVNGNQ